MRRFLPSGLAALACAGCNVIFGVGGLTFEDPAPAPGGMGSGASGGSGGSVSAGGASSGGQGGVGTGGAPAGRCGTFDVMADDFDDGALAPSWTVAKTGTALMTETAGAAVATLPVSSNAQSASLVTTYAYDLSSSRAVIRLPVVPDASANAVTYFRVGQLADRMAAFHLGYGTLAVGYDAFDGTLAEEEGSVLYDVTAHRWWSIREQDGAIVFETSPDGARWSLLETAELDFDASYAVAELGIAAPGALAIQREARFDQFRGDGSASSLCPAHRLTDDFEDTSVPAQWRNATGTGCAFSEGFGSLTMTLSSTTAYCGYHSARQYDLRGDAVTIEVVSPASGAGEIQFAATLDGMNDLETAFSDGAFEMQLEVGGGESVMATPFDPAADRYWRLREAEGTLYWETSPDGSEWLVSRSAEAPFSVGAVEIQLEVHGTAAVVPTTTTVFDNLNILPP